jgi:hypothetical protein
MGMLQENNTTEEAARFLRLQRQTLEAWRLRGTGPAFVKLGRRVVYRREAIERFIAERERTSTSAPSATVPSKPQAPLSPSRKRRPAPPAPQRRASHPSRRRSERL